MCRPKHLPSFQSRRINAPPLPLLRTTRDTCWEALYSLPHRLLRMQKRFRGRASRRSSTTRIFDPSTTLSMYAIRRKRSICSWRVRYSLETFPVIPHTGSDVLAIPLGPEESWGEVVRTIEGLDPRRPAVVVCATGFRSKIFASFLTRSGFNKVVAQRLTTPNDIEIRYTFWMEDWASTPLPWTLRPSIDAKTT